MPKVARMGDLNTGGGVIQTIPQSTVYANGKLISVNGSKGSGHAPGIHALNAWDTANGSSTVFIEGIAVNDQGDADTCAHARTGGSSDVFTHGPGIKVTEDISLSTVVRASDSQSSTDNDVRDVKFNNDGSKVFILGRGNDNVYEYSVSTPFDVSSITLLRQLDISVVDSSQGDNAANSIEFNTDGTKLFMLGQGQDLVNEYALSTGFDLSTATFTVSFDISAQENLPYGLAFNNDGTKMYITGWTGDDINEYELSTGFDISTTSYSQLFSVSSECARPSAVQFNSNGTTMYVLNGHDDPTIFQYTLTTAFDVSTASYSDKSFSVLDQETKARGFCFGDNGTKLYVAGWQGDDINQYAAASEIVGD